MAETWRQALAADPFPALLHAGDPALAYFTRRDLLDEPVEPVSLLWDLPEARRLLNKQQPGGAWLYPGKDVDPLNGTNYTLLETFRSLRVLVEMYALNWEHPVIRQAAEYVFSRQTVEGDIRGILGNQTMPYYHGAILALLIQAGYAADERTRRGLDWLLGMRQADGGWIIPAQAVPAKGKTPQFWRGPALPPDRARPSSHLATDMALRPFAAHPAYRARPEVQAAAWLLKGRLLKPDAYNDRRGAEYWLKFQYPFWFHSLPATLDSLSRLGFDRADEDVRRGLDWLLDHQSADGLWPTGYDKGKGADRNRRWVGLAICRVVKRFWG